MLIGIDASSVRTGFAFGSVHDLAPKGGVWTAPGASDLVFDTTLAGLSDSLGTLARAIRAEHVCIEAPLLINDSDHGAHTAMVLIQLTGALRAAAKRAGCQVHLCAVSTVRRHFIGKGDLRSAEAKRAVQHRCKQLGWPFIDDNHSDSMAVWDYGIATYCRRSSLFARGAA